MSKLALLGGTSLDATGSRHSETIVGNAGSNLIRGDGGNDHLDGKAGDDRLIGGDGADRLSGGSGDDVLIGGEGDNKLIGGTGNDVLTGGHLGRDSFYFSSGQSADADIIEDFNGPDRIVLDSAVFTQLAAGNLAAGNFALDGPNDADDYIAYNTGTGVLTYNPTGNNLFPFSAVQIATLTGAPSISASDFLIL